MVGRKCYIKELLNYKDKPFIKVIKGVRRVGKSTLLELYIEELKKTSIADSHILKINFELPNSFEIKTYLDLTNEVLKFKENKEGKIYLFFDEIGRVSEWERAINAFHAMKEFDIYITGSNYDLLSSDLSTFLAGRYVEILIQPFSYKEFLKLYPKATFKDYTLFGGTPSIGEFNLDYELSMNVLRDSFNSAIYQDIISRYNIRDTHALNKLIYYIFANTSQTFSALSISKYFKSENISISVDTILTYLKNIEDAFLIYRVPRNDLQGKRILKTKEKYFIADHGFREAIIGSNTNRIELILENIFFIELKRRGYDVYIGKVGEKEVDFVAIKNNMPSYYQVAYLMENEETRIREFASLKEINDNHDKYILTRDKVDFSKDGIIHLKIEDFLLSN